MMRPGDAVTRTPIRLGAYAVGLIAVFAAAWGLGNVSGPPPAAPVAARATEQSGNGHHGNEHSDNSGGGHDGAAHSAGAPAGPAIPGGLQVAQDGYRLEPLTDGLTTAGPTDLRFRILGPDGAPVTRYATTHDKDLHLIVVRRDLSGFQHVHPTRDADGVWSIPLRVAAGGQYRMFADFRPADLDRSLTLGVDLPAAGRYQPVALPAPARTATVDGYTVRLNGDLRPGADAKLTLTVSQAGRPVTDLQPYLGAYGHLVALRAGDLAYLHVHPDGAPGDGRTAPGPGITFYAQVPSAGGYRLYLDFQHAGRVHTAEFTMVAGGATTPTNPTGPTAEPSPSTAGGHGGPGHGHN